MNPLYIQFQLGILAESYVFHTLEGRLFLYSRHSFVWTESSRPHARCVSQADVNTGPPEPALAVDRVTLSPYRTQECSSPKESSGKSQRSCLLLASLYSHKHGLFFYWITCFCRPLQCIWGSLPLQGQRK